MLTKKLHIDFFLIYWKIINIYFPGPLESRWQFEIFDWGHLGDAVLEEQHKKCTIPLQLTVRMLPGRFLLYQLEGMAKF